MRLRRAQAHEGLSPQSGLGCPSGLGPERSDRNCLVSVQEWGSESWARVEIERAPKKKKYIVMIEKLMGSGFWGRRGRPDPAGARRARSGDARRWGTVEGLAEEGWWDGGSPDPSLNQAKVNPHGLTTHPRRAAAAGLNSLSGDHGDQTTWN